MHEYSIPCERVPNLTMEAIAKHDFKATAPDELSFKKGSLLRVSVIVSGLPAAVAYSWSLNSRGNQRGYAAP